MKEQQTLWAVVHKKLYIVMEALPYGMKILNDIPET